MQPHGAAVTAGVTEHTVRGAPLARQRGGFVSLSGGARRKVIKRGCWAKSGGYVSGPHSPGGSLARGPPPKEQGLVLDSNYSRCWQGDLATQLLPSVGAGKETTLPRHLPAPTHTALFLATTRRVGASPQRISRGVLSRWQQPAAPPRCEQQFRTNRQVDSGGTSA